MASAGADRDSQGDAQQRYVPARLSLALTLAYLVTAAALITLRALISELEFVSLGWILVLALVPLVPWLIPALGPVIARIAPLVRSVKLPGGIEISLSAAARPVAGLGPVETALTSDHLVYGLTASATPFTTTDSDAVIAGVKTVRAANAEAVAVDLGFGTKWRLPNLYFLAWIMVNDPVTRWMVFTETRGDTPAVFVGLCSASDLRLSIEAVHSAYAEVAPQLEFTDPTRPQNREQLANEFNKIRGAVAPPQAGEVPTLAWVTVADVRTLLGPRLATASVDWTSDLDRAGLETIVRSTTPYVAATTADGRFRGLVEQRQVALELTRRVLEQR
jgi:hypothetical protein